MYFISQIFQTGFVIFCEKFKKKKKMNCETRNSNTFPFLPFEGKNP